MIAAMVLMDTLRLRRRRERDRIALKRKNNVTYCRTCLSTEDLQPIFQKNESVNEKTAELFLATGIEVTANDGYPQTMCVTCCDLLKLSLEFRSTSQKADLALQNMGPNAKHMPKPKITKKTPKQKTGDTSGAYSIYDDHFADDGFDDFSGNYDVKHNIKQEKSADDSMFNANDYLSTEMRVPKEERKRPVKKKVVTHYKCPTCGKVFTMKNTFRAHLRFHTDYCVCELCGKKCRNNNLLLLHKRGKHGAERVHKCAYCDYASANKEGLVIHERRHTGEKPYICDHCGSSFHRRSNLVQHIAIHLPDKNFQCELCQKKFRSKKFLRSHKFKQHQEKRYTYVCHVCKNHFRTTDSARKHLLRAHGIPREAQGPVYRIPNVALKGKCIDTL